MKLDSISHGFASFTLTPEDCLHLAQACEDWPECSIERADAVVRVELIGAALRAAAIAAQLQYWCNPIVIRQAMKDLGMPMN